jgi:hypothetical protein
MTDDNLVEVNVDFLSVASVVRTVTVKVPRQVSTAVTLQLARKQAEVVMARDEDRENATGAWQVIRVIDPPFIDSAPRFRPTTVADGLFGSAEPVPSPKPGSTSLPGLFG